MSEVEVGLNDILEYLLFSGLTYIHPNGNCRLNIFAQKFLKMKSIRIVVIMMVSLVALASCTSTTIVKTKKTPPGQVKKTTGSQSAAPYAPGQQKKKATAPKK